jgi:hypothetical protein
MPRSVRNCQYGSVQYNKLGCCGAEADRRRRTGLDVNTIARSQDNSLLGNSFGGGHFERYVVRSICCRGGVKA